VLAAYPDTTLNKRHGNTVNIDDPQSVLRAIRKTPPGRAIVMILHTRPHRVPQQRASSSASRAATSVTASTTRCTGGMRVNRPACVAR
jgi:hypothetical protein